MNISSSTPHVTGRILQPEKIIFAQTPRTMQPTEAGIFGIYISAHGLVDGVSSLAEWSLSARQKPFASSKLANWLLIYNVRAQKQANDFLRSLKQVAPFEWPVFRGYSQHMKTDRE